MTYIDVEGMRSAAHIMSGAADGMRSAGSSMFEHMQTLQNNVSWFGDHVQTLSRVLQDHQTEMARFQDRKVKMETIRGKMEIVRFTMITMQAENFTRMQQGKALAYGGDAFIDLAKQMQDCVTELNGL